MTIADDHGYDQGIVYARDEGEALAPHGEHMPTYGVDRGHRGVAAGIGRKLREMIRVTKGATHG